MVKKGKLAVALVLIGLLILALRVNSAPTGASIQFDGNSTKPVASPMNRTDGKGTVNYMRLSTVQQNDRWKAYVGNVSGVLTLDDANSYTIYDWQIAGTVTGTVFASRNSTVNWNTVNCSNLTHTQAEEDFLSVTYTSSDSIENTFTSTAHTSFLVGDNLMNKCNYTSLYVNDTATAKDASAMFQEVTLHDRVGAFIYAARIRDNQYSYRNDSSLADFEMLVAERANAGPAITYFFFVEIQ